jgi:hypothetical protein
MNGAPEVWVGFYVWATRPSAPPAFNRIENPSAYRGFSEDIKTDKLFKAAVYLV